MNTDKFIGGAVPSPKDDRDFQFEYLAGLTETTIEVVVPETLDLRDPRIPVRDQGPDGACVGFSCACMKTWQETKDTSDIIEDQMSPAFVYNMRDNRSISGMIPRNALEILRLYGIVYEKDFPYVPGNIVIPAGSLLAKASRFKIDGYAMVRTLIGLKQALASSGVCILILPVYNFTKQFWIASAGETLKGYHCVSIVGYNTEGFILQNSWGTKWGNDGYTIYPYLQWGSHVECWSSIDAPTVLIAKSVHMPDTKKNYSSIFSRVFHFFHNLYKKRL